MRRISAMTLGFVMVFIGIQLNLVETYVLTPRFSNFLSENASPGEIPTLATQNQQANNPAYNSPYYQASFSGNVPTMSQQMGPRPTGPKIVSPPGWLCWPILFLGTVVFLHGLSLRRE
jgi:hypothetical protein